MKKLTVLLFLIAGSALHAAPSASDAVGHGPMTFRADRMAVDNVTKAAKAEGHVEAKAGVFTLLSDSLWRDDEGLTVFSDPTYATTCTNEIGHTHWNVTGELRYREDDFVLLKNAWLTFYEVPVFYLPYLYYPLGTACGFRWMPGYTGRWGAYLLTRYRYHLLGDNLHRENTWWLQGDTNLDYRYQQGFGVGEDFTWGLGDFGQGSFKAYYAWDQNVSSENLGMNTRSDANWMSRIPEERYGLTMDHRWEATERDSVIVRGSYYSDLIFPSEFMRKSFLDVKSQWLSYSNSAAIWEHTETGWAAGAEVSGRLNDFYAMTDRLPEFYFDFNPRPVPGLPINYESANRAGWLARHAAEYAAGLNSVFGFNPGPWCDYDAFRFDTYHRVTAPFKMVDDLVSVVPRVGYRGTYWSDTGLPDHTGWSRATPDQPEMIRSVIESGVTSAARGTGFMDDGWRHVVEPYVDVLLQEACYSGRSNDSRPYVFDNLDASMTWEDQFAGRGRNLPYSYYGLTPGVRNVWETTDETGRVRPYLDLDAYAAFMFGRTSFERGDGWSPEFGEYEMHKLAKLGRRNYGKNAAYAMPGLRAKWMPAVDQTLFARVEYDPDDQTVAYADLTWSHRLSDTFHYSLSYAFRDVRYWDFASSPYSSAMHEDGFNRIKLNTARFAFGYQPFDWLAMGPYLRYDFDENEVDCVGGWFDYLTDCLGFRLLVEYETSYTRLDGMEYDDDLSVGFYIYLRAFGADSGNVFLGQ